MEEKKAVWKDHCNILLNHPAPTKVANIDTSQIMQKLDVKTRKILLKEVRDSISKLKNNKAPGIDNIHAEMIK